MIDRLDSRSHSAIQHWPIVMLRIYTGLFFAWNGFGKLRRDNFADGMEGFLGAQAEEEAGWFDWMGSDDDEPMANQSFIISVESLDEQDVAIRIEQTAALEEDDFRAMEVRDEQALLALLKGNID